jgi:hypothetical protein
VKKLFIHIGAPKTGTTAIQLFLRHNQRLLESEFGVSMPNLLSHGQAAKMYIYATQTLSPRRAKQTGIESLAEFNPEYERGISALADSIATPAALCSNELLFSLDESAVRRLKRALSSVFSSFEVILYLRRQDLRATGAYLQAYKGGYDHLPAFRRVLKRRNLNDLAVIDTWGEAFGSENVRVALYDDVMREENDVIAHFMLTLGIDDLSSFSNVTPKNITWGLHQAYASRVIRDGCENEPFEKIRAFVETLEPGPRYPARRAEAIAFYRTFARENELIRRRYFPHKTSLFEEDFRMYPEKFDFDAERLKYSASELLEQYKSFHASRENPVEPDQQQHAVETQDSVTTHHLYLDPVEFDGNRIIYQWRVTPHSDLFRNQSVFFEYPDIELQTIPESTWCAMFFAHIAKAAESTGHRWIFHFPARVSVHEVLPWARYLNLKNVMIASDSITESPPASPHGKENPVDESEDTPIAVLLGGGKDSMASLGMLAELYGDENVVSVVMAHHPRNSRQHRLRHETQLIRPLLENTPIRNIYLQTSVRNCFSKQQHTRQSGLVLYFATLLPYWLLRRINTVTFSYEFTLFFVRQRKGHVEFGHPAARTESVDRLADELQSAYSMPCSLVNINSGLSKHVAFRVLAHRYPAYLKALFMCEGTLDRNCKWCAECWKCFEYIMMCLVEKTPCEIDIDSYLDGSRYIRNLFEQAQDLGRHPDTGNLVWSRAFGGHAVHYGTMCHSFARLDLDYVDATVSEASARKLRQMKDWFGRREFPLFECYVPEFIERLSLHKRAELVSILEEYCRPCRDEDDRFLLANEWVSLSPEMRRELPELDAGQLVAPGAVDTESPSGIWRAMYNSWRSLFSESGRN